MKSGLRKAGIASALIAGVLVVLTIGYSLGQTRPSGEGDMTVGVASKQPLSPEALSGASSPSEPQGTRARGDAVADESAALNADASQVQATTAPVDRLIIRNAGLEIRVKSVKTALTGLRTAAARTGAEIADLSVSVGDPGTMPLDASAERTDSRGPSTAYVTLRVPADKLDSLESEVSGLGTVLSQTSNANDVTEQAIDLDARLKNLRAEETRLRSFLDRTNKVSDLLAVERELARVRGEIESMDAQLTYLRRQAARATLTVTLSEPGPVVQPAGQSWGLREAVTRGIQAAASLVTVIVTISIPLAVLALLLAAVIMPVRAVRRRLLARRASVAIRDTGSDESDA